MSSPLAGRTIVVTREHGGELAERLIALGADVVHVPMIAATDPPDGGVAARAALGELGRYAWLVVTSPNGARRVTVEPGPSVRLAAVGRSTAEALTAATGRTPDLLPTTQRLEGLLAVFPAGDGRVLALRGDRADPELVRGLEALGWEVDDVVAYHTVDRHPTDADRRRVAGADVVLFASGSAATSWASAFDGCVPGEALTIGPSTTAVAARAGITVAAEAAAQSVDGLVELVLERYA